MGKSIGELQVGRWISIAVFGITVIAACGSLDAGLRADAAPAIQQGSADAVLSDFDRRHPSCQLWTNWQKLCSRTGPDGAAECKTDNGFAAQPSEPFCAVRRVPDGRIDTTRDDPPAQQRSRNRLCDTFAIGEDGIRRCTSYAAARPFDGRRAEAIAHPLCRRWQTISPSPTAAPGALVGPASCVEWVERLPCPQVVGNASRFPAPDTIVMPTVRDVRRRPVWGVYCL